MSEFIKYLIVFILFVFNPVSSWAMRKTSFLCALPMESTKTLRCKNLCQRKSP